MEYTRIFRYIERIFREEVAPKFAGKEFNPMFISSQPSYGSDKYIYNYEGVIIRFFGRHTYAHDDYDYHIDYSVWVEGNLVVSREKQ